MFHWLKRKFLTLKDINAGYVEKELYRFCNAQINKKNISCGKCPVEKYCHIFLAAIPNLHLAIVDAENSEVKK
jgi:hypothetical protein